MKKGGTLKGKEAVIVGIKEPAGEKGPRYLLESKGDKEFIKMNSNSYLGMSLNKEVIAAEEEAVQMFGTGPGAVRFINGTFKPHVELERRLAAFHAREAAMIFSSAYAAEFAEGVFTVIDDSHGVGAYGETGRGMPEVTGVDGIDIIIATLGKALGVNGGYVVTSAGIIEYLRETAPLYIF